MFGLLVYDETDESMPPICHMFSNLQISEQLDGIMPVFADDAVSLGMNN